MPTRALFATSFHKSLGETFTLARFGADLRAEGWSVEFLSSGFAADFLRGQGHEVTLFGDRLEGNRRLLAESLRRLGPDLLVTADFFLYEATDARRIWSVRWLTETGLPLLTFDHLKFHPEPRTIQLGFQPRILKDPKLMENFPRVPPKAIPRSQVRVPALPPEVTALIRPCPVHDPRPQADPRLRFYDVSRGDAAGAPSSAARRRLGLGEAEKVVVAPIGSWALDLARHLELPYPDLLARVLLRYLGRSAGEVRVLLLGSGLPPAREVRGRVTLEHVSGLAFDDFRDLLASADLVVGDNVTSATLGRAVMAGVPAAVLVSGLSVRREAGRLALDAPFAPTRFVRELIRATEHSAAGSVFPFSVYPLGWREEMQPLFDGNPYRDAVECLEMFDEGRTAERLSSLVFEAEARARLIARQRAYRRMVEALPGAGELVRSALEGAVGAVA